jgi:hypothetical protein
MVRARLARPREVEQPIEAIKGSRKEARDIAGNIPARALPTRPVALFAAML